MQAMEFHWLSEPRGHKLEFQMLYVISRGNYHGPTTEWHWSDTRGLQFGYGRWCSAADYCSMATGFDKCVHVGRNVARRCGCPLNRGLPLANSDFEQHVLALDGTAQRVIFVTLFSPDQHFLKRKELFVVKKLRSSSSSRGTATMSSSVAN
eukprot:IDg9913t1